MSETGRPTPTRLPKPVTDLGRSAFRAYGAATAVVRPYPDFLLIGAKRAGTTSLYFHLLRHPQVLPLFPTARLLPKRRDSKGAHYFDTRFARGDRWYRGHFPSLMTRRLAERRLGGPVVVGEASPYYLYHPLAPARAAAVVGGAKILVALRDPVERTFSAWREQRRNGVETLTFEEALAAEAARTEGEEQRLIEEPGYRSFAHEFQTYRAQSEYAAPLARWLQHFPREQVKVVASEDYYADPGAVVDEIFEFLDLPPGAAPESKVLNPAPKAPMEPEVRRALVEHFAPCNQALEQMLGRTFPWSRP